MTAVDPSICSCGRVDDHVIAERMTADGFRIEVWSDGMVTSAMGGFIRGVGRARYAFARRLNLRAALVVVDEIPLYDAAEIGALVREARRAVRLPGAYLGHADAAIREVRRRMRVLEPRNFCEVSSPTTGAR